MLDTCEKYGEICLVTVGMRPFIFVTDPVAVTQILKDADFFPKSRDLYSKFKSAFGDGLVTSDGETWKEHNRLLSTWFQGRGRHMPAVNEYANMLVETVKKSAAQGQSFDLEHKLAQTLLFIFGKVAFNHDFAKNMDDTERFLDLVASLGPDLSRSMFQDMVPFRKWSPPKLRELLALIADLTTRYQQDLEARKDDIVASKSTKPDLAYALLTSDLSLQHVKDEVMTLLGAGHETTAALCTFAVYVICEHPDCLEKIRREVQNVLGDPSNIDFSYEQVAEMKYLNQVFKEVMRLYPPVPFFAREAVQDTELNGVRIPRRTMLLIPVVTMNMLTRLWGPNAKEFDPDRFGEDKTIPPGQFIPFSGGRRVCIGQHLALMEATIIVAKMLWHFDWKRDTSKKMKTTSAITMRTVDGCWMHASTRNP